MQTGRDPSGVGPPANRNKARAPRLGWARPRTGICASYAVIAWDNVG